MEIELATPVWPEVRSYDDILVVPTQTMFQSMTRSLKAGPIWPDWDSVPRARHFRDAIPADDRPDPVEPTRHIDDDRPYFWIGAIVNHFGHFVAEFSTRILPSITANPEAVLVFTTQYPAHGTFDALPAFIKAMLDWYEVPRERVLIVLEPTRFRRLSVVAEPELLGEQFPGEPSAPYLAALERWTEHRLGPRTRRGTIFVTRSGQPYRFGGEAVLDAAMRAAGATVIQPETLGLADQIAAYAGAETLVFAEGSAIHGLQFLGALGRVIVLTRRPGLRIAEPKLRARAAALTYVDASRTLVAGFFPAESGMRHTVDLGRSYSVLDPAALIAGLRAEGIELAPHWDEAAFRSREAADLEAFRHYMLASIKGNPASLQPILKGLRTSQVAGAGAHGRWLIGEQAAARGWSGPIGAARRSAWLGYYAAAPALAVLGPIHRALRGG